MTDARVKLPSASGAPGEAVIGLGTPAPSRSVCWSSRLVSPWAAPPAMPSTPPAILGPRLAHALLPVPGKRDSDWAYAWVPVAAPLLGALLAAWANILLKLAA